MIEMVLGEDRASKLLIANDLAFQGNEIAEKELSVRETVNV